MVSSFVRSQHFPSEPHTNHNHQVGPSSRNQLFGLGSKVYIREFHDVTPANPIYSTAVFPTRNYWGKRFRAAVLARSHHRRRMLLIVSSLVTVTASSRLSKAPLLHAAAAEPSPASSGPIMIGVEFIACDM